MSAGLPTYDRLLYASLGGYYLLSAAVVAVSRPSGWRGILCWAGAPVAAACLDPAVAALQLPEAIRGALWVGEAATLSVWFVCGQSVRFLTRPVWLVLSVAKATRVRSRLELRVNAAEEFFARRRLMALVVVSLPWLGTLFAVIGVEAYAAFCR